MTNKTNEMNDMLEVKLADNEAFLQVVESLTRMGIASVKQKKLWQSCHLLQKRGRYYIVHFKEMFALDGRPSNMTKEDITRRNQVANLLQQWGLLTIVEPEKYVVHDDERVNLFILRYDEKGQWQLIPKYTIGRKKTLHSKNS